MKYVPTTKPLWLKRVFYWYDALTKCNAIKLLDFITYIDMVSVTIPILPIISINKVICHN